MSRRGGQPLAFVARNPVAHCGFVEISGIFAETDVESSVGRGPVGPIWEAGVVSGGAVGESAAYGPGTVGQPDSGGSRMGVVVVVIAGVAETIDAEKILLKGWASFAQVMN